MQFASPHIILIDGKSGVGKSSLADRLAESLDAAIVRLDDVYPGWGGLESGRDSVIDTVLRSMRGGGGAFYQSWDWATEGPGPRVRVPQRDVLIVEGCGASTAESRAFASVSIWVECDEEVRQSRLYVRDGSDFDEHVPGWEAQVDKHIRTNDPIGSATVRIRT